MVSLPRADLLPSFQGVEWCLGESDGGRSATSITTGSVVFLPTLESDPETGDFDSPSTPRGTIKKLTLDQRVDVRRLASTRSLRELALTFSVSHETIRAIIRENPLQATWAD